MNQIPVSLGARSLPSLLNTLYDGVYMLDRSIRVVFWNNAAQRITGYRSEEILGSACESSLNHCTAEGRVLCRNGCPMRQAIDSGTDAEVNVFVRHRDGARLPLAVRICPMRDDAGNIVGAMQVFSEDTSRALAVRRLDELENLADWDALTGSRSRRFMQEQVVLRVDESRRTGRPAGCIFVDVNSFKAINDELGHAAGDEALRVVAHTLEANVRPTDVVGRWGGDEFLVLLMDATDSLTGELANRLSRLIRNCRIVQGDREITLAAAVGATVSLPDDTPETLLHRADQLMYRMKGSTRPRSHHLPVMQASA